MIFVQHLGILGYPNYRSMSWEETPLNILPQAATTASLF